MYSYLIIDELSLRRSLMHIVEETKYSKRLLLFLQPYLSNIQCSSLQTFYNCIESGMNGIYIAIDNLVMDCLSNDELYLLIRKFIQQYTK